jgi:hypothetical protein
MHPNQRKIQAMGEVIIPLLGYFVFDWDLFFIGIYFVIDLLVTEVFVQLKYAKVIQYQSIQLNGKKWLLLHGSTTLLAAVIVALFIVFSKVYYPMLDLTASFIDFLAYEEAGIPIPQGYILLPLVVLGNFQQYKLLFLKTQRYRMANIELMSKLRQRALLLIVAFLCFFSALSGWFALPEPLVLLVFVGGKFWIDLYQR